VNKRTTPHNDDAAGARRGPSKNISPRGKQNFNNIGIPSFSGQMQRGVIFAAQHMSIHKDAVCIWIHGGRWAAPIYRFKKGMRSAVCFAPSKNLF
jgi:hypothetical protein